MRTSTENSTTFRRFVSENRSFAMNLPEHLLLKMLSACKAARGCETGGIVVGYYNNDLDTAIVTNISKAPGDSTFGPTWLHRGVRGVQRWLSRLWRKRRYYLGEWHFHPFDLPFPSPTDIQQMRKISESEHYSCPEPLLLIVSKMNEIQYQQKAFVFPKGMAFIELKQPDGNRP